MALADAHSTYDENNKGNREDLGKIIFNIDPAETPFLSMAGKGKATNTLHEWTTDVLEAPAQNAHIEGADATITSRAARSRLNNYTQILTKTAQVTGTQEHADKTQVKSEMNYQLLNAGQEIKTDCELSCIGMSNAKAAGAEATTAREFGSLDSYMVDNFMAASGSSTPTGNGVDVSDYAGTDRALTQDLFDEALEQLWSNHKGNQIKAIVSAKHKRMISRFDIDGAKRVSIDDKVLRTSITVYDGDFSTVAIIPSRDILSGNIFFIDPKYVSMDDMRALHKQDLSKTGDSEKKQLVWETTMCVKNPSACAQLTDLI